MRSHEGSPPDYQGGDEDLPFVKDVARALAGDDSAWTALHQVANRYVVGIARHQFRLDASTAEDISQQVWVQLFLSLDRIEQPERLLGWLRTTTWRACINHVNTRAAELVDSSVLDSFESSHFDDPADAVVREETCRTIRRSVSGLGSVGGRVLDRQLLDPDERYRDMSEAWSIPIGSLGPERKRAIERLGRTPEVLALR